MQLSSVLSAVKTQLRKILRSVLSRETTGRGHVPSLFYSGGIGSNIDASGTNDCRGEGNFVPLSEYTCSVPRMLHPVTVVRQVIAIVVLAVDKF